MFSLVLFIGNHTGWILEVHYGLQATLLLRISSLRWRSINIWIYELWLLLVKLSWHRLAHLRLTTSKYRLCVHVVQAGVHWNTLHWNGILSTAVIELVDLHLLLCGIIRLLWSLIIHHDNLGFSCTWILHHSHLRLINANHLSLALACIRRVLCCSHLLWALILIIMWLGNDLVLWCSLTSFTLLLIRAHRCIYNQHYAPAVKKSRNDNDDYFDNTFQWSISTITIVFTKAIVRTVEAILASVSYSSIIIITAKGVVIRTKLSEHLFKLNFNV